MAQEDKEKKVSLDDVFDDSNITEDDEEEESSEKKRGSRRRRRKQINLRCPLCENGIKTVTYKDIYQLKKFTSVRGKIISSEKSGVCSKHQRQLSRAIKRARHMALLPYIASDF